MAEEQPVREGQAVLRLSAVRAAAYIRNRVASRRLELGLTFLLFALTFVVYFFSAEGASLTLTDLSLPLPSTFNHPVRLADAFLHGRLDVANAVDLGWLDWAEYDGKFYPLEPPMTAIVVVPGVALFGLALNQTLVSVTVGALGISVLYQMVRGLTQKVSEQIWLTLLFAFGTVYWWNAVNGGVWYFNHTLAVLFLFLAVYETLVGKRPFLAGLFLGAAYMTRLPTILSLPFFVIMFSEQWWRPASELEGLPSLKRVDLRSLRQLGSQVANLLKLSFVYMWKRLNLKPLLWLGAGVGVFLVLGSIHNYVRFDTPLHASYYHWPGVPINAGPGGLFEHGLFDITYIPRHVSVVFEQMPYVSSEAPYVYPSWGGLAVWATTPVFLYALFAGVENRIVRVVGAVAIITSLAIFSVLPALRDGLGSHPALDWADFSVPYHLNLLPFWLLIAYGVSTGLKNKLVLACWLAIIPMALTHFTVGVTGWPQFGYRYLLDFAPFILILTWLGMGSTLKWHHMVLITVGIIVNLAGVLWIYKFNPDGVGGIVWVTW